MNPQPSIFRRAQPYAANALTLVSAALILAAVLFLSPWVSRAALLRSQLAAQGIELPTGASFPAQFAQNAAAGQFAVEGSGTAFPAASALAALSGTSSAAVQTPTWVMGLLIGAAVVAAGAAVWSWVDARQNETVGLLILVCGLAAALHFAYFVGVQNRAASTDLLALVTPGFWIALLGTVGLFVQVLIKRPVFTSALNGTTLVRRPVRRMGGVSLVQNIAVAFDALLANKLRSALTMLGIVIGVMSVVALLSVGQGATADITSQIEGIGTNLISVSSMGFYSRLTLEDAQAIQESVSGLAGVAPQYGSNATATANDASYDVQVIGTSPDYITVRNVEIESGRFFTADEYESKDRVVVLGSTVVEELFANLDPLGSDVRIGGRTYEVIGVLAEQDSGFGGDANDQVILPLTTGYRYLFSGRAVVGTDYLVSSITLSAERSDQVSLIISEVEDLLRARHDLDIDEDNDFNVANQQQLLETFSEVSGTLTAMLGAIASVSLLVGGIGIMNISLVSVTERTKEIGLRKALGARRFQILQQFLIETVVLSTMGGVFGVLAGVGVAVLVNNSGLLNAVIAPEAILLGLGFSVAVGIFFGVYPANRAASLHPIEALRYE